MDEKNKRIAISTCLGFATIYLSFAFVLADLNPFAWSEASRFCMVSLGFFFSLFCYIFDGNLFE